MRPWEYIHNPIILVSIKQENKLYEYTCTEKAHVSTEKLDAIHKSWSEDSLKSQKHYELD